MKLNANFQLTVTTLRRWMNTFGDIHVHAISRLCSFDLNISNVVTSAVKLHNGVQNRCCAASVETVDVTRKRQLVDTRIVNNLLGGIDVCADSGLGIPVRCLVFPRDDVLTMGSLPNVAQVRFAAVET